MKRMINNLLLLTMFVLLSGSCCCDEGHHVALKNNSDKTIYYGLSYSYPDTSLIDFVHRGNQAYKMVSGEQANIIPESRFNSCSTIQFFIFDADVIEHESWDSIDAHYKILKRYTFTQRDMERMNWTITYP
ncbi:MAG: hypothetical protein PHS30_00915 [Bacteroidales bacterium]|nr:hypothetical protein [Bacteroidales bacterium]